MTRTVTVALRASNSQYDAAMTQSAAKTKALAETTKRAAATHKQAFNDLGRSSMVMGGLLVGGFALATKAAMDFNAEMSLVKTLSHATATQMTALRGAALTLGQGIGFSAVQTAKAETELVKAGISVADIMGGALKGSLDLAAAGQTDVAAATETAAIAMTQFKLRGSDVPHIADLLAAGADKALGSVDDLSMALKSGGLVASQFGISIEDTMGTLAAFAQAGLMGESAGTDLRQMLLKLAAPSKQSRETMDQLGISVYDATGKFVGITNLAGQLHDKLGKLSQAQRDHALAVMFGARAIVGANILYQNGAAGIQDWIGKVDDSGFAARQAAGKMDNLKGDLSKLGAAFRSDLIGSGSSANGVLRDGAQATTGLLKAYGSLPHEVQAGATAFAGIGGAVALTGGAMLVTIPKIAALDKALLELTNGSMGAKAALANLGRAGLIAGLVTGAVIGVDELTKAFEKDRPSVDAVTSSLLEFAHTGQAVGAMAKITGTDLNDLAGKVKAAAENRGTSFINPWQHMPQQISDARHEVDALDKSLASLVGDGHADIAAKSFENIRNALLSSGVSEKQVESAFNDYYTALDSVTVSAETAGGAISRANGPIRDQAAAAKAASDALTAQADALKALTDPIFAMANAMSGQASAVTAYADAVKKHGRNSREASDALFGLAKANADVTSSADGLAAGVAAGTTSVEDMTAQLRTWVSQGLLTSGQADALASKVGKLTAKADTLSKTPAVVNVKTTGVPTALHELSAVEVAKKRAAIAISVPIQVTGLDSFYRTLATAHTAATGNVAHGLPSSVLLPGVTPVKHATGGLVGGVGGPTSDNQLALLSPGEYVLRASAVRKVGLSALNQINRYATGGLVIPGPSRYNAATPLSSQALGLARSGASTDRIQALVAAYDDYLHKLDQAAQREKLLGDIHTAQITLDKAKTKERADAQQQLNDANRALRDFDQAAVVDREKAATDRLIASIEKRAAAQDLLYQRQDNAYQVGQRTAKDEIAGLTARMNAELKFSDEWTALYEQRQQVLDDVAAAEKATADAAQAAADATAAAVDKATGAYNDQLSALNRMLDEQSSIEAQIAQSSAAFADKQQQLHAREVDAETTFHTGMAQAQQTYADAEQRILAARRDALTGWASISEIASVTWGNTLGQLQGNISDQIGAFSEWMDRLADARRRGVSEAVVSALGLDQGPQALGQLRQFSAATQAEIDALNASVAARTALAGQEVHSEQLAGYGQLGADLVAAQQQYADAVSSVQAQFRADQAAIASELEQDQTDFLAQQADLAQQLADVGTDQARSYGDALAAGLRSQIPAVQAAAQQLMAAAGLLTTAQGGPATATTGNQATAAPSTASASGGYSTAVNAATITAMPESAWTSAQRRYADMHGLSGTRVFDTGGWLQPGLTLAFNGTGQPERVMTAAQHAEATAPTVIENHTYVVVDGEVIDHRVETKLATRKGVAAIAGAMP